MNTARRLTGLSRRRRRRWTRDQIQVTDPEVMRRSIRGASIGNFMEWYDFGVYGYIATTIAQDIGIRWNYATDRSSIGVRHRQPDGAGLHADLGGVGGRGDAVLHTGSCRSPVAGIAADGRDRARGPCVGRGRGVEARYGRGLGDYGVFVVSVMLPPPP
jgi:hypothetical protein